MGIKNLHKFLTTVIQKSNGIKEVHFSELQDKVIAVDVSIYIYQFASAIKSSMDDMKTSDGKITTHIQGILSKTLGMLKKKIKPIFVFDGKPPQLKMNVLENRQDNKLIAKDKIDVINKQIDDSVDDAEITLLNEAKVKLLKQSVNVSRKQMEECKEIIRLLGMPIIESKEEADPQCAWLVKNNLAFAVASEDMDILTFGTTRLIRKLSAKDHVTEYNLPIILEELGLNQEEFIDLCILLGCDYTDTIEGIGPKKAYDLIKKYRSIDKIITDDKNFINKKYKLPDNFNYQAARDYFMNAPIIELTNQDIKWSKPNYKELERVLIEKYEYDKKNVDKMLGILQGGYYSVICGEKNKTQYNKDKSAYLKSIRNNINFDSDSD